jgi:hypothetical protein
MTISEFLSDRDSSCPTREGGYPAVEMTFYDFINIQHSKLVILFFRIPNSEFISFLTSQLLSFPPPDLLTFLPSHLLNFSTSQLLSFPPSAFPLPNSIPSQLLTFLTSQLLSFPPSDLLTFLTSQLQFFQLPHSDFRILIFSPS